MGPVLLQRQLPSRAVSVSAARELVAEVLHTTPYADLVDDARLAVSELVTNALVHAGTVIGLVVRADDHGVLVEVHDGNPQLPLVRRRAREAGTGRGLHMVESLADEWGIAPDGERGKAVWFRLGRPAARPAEAASSAPAAGRQAEVSRVELLEFPLLIHAAWQEHSATLLREYLLMSLDDGDETAAFVRHAEASEALHLLAEQAPVLDVGEDPHAVMSDAVEPAVTAETFVLTVPRTMLGNFDVLDEMMNDAVAAADAGNMLIPTTQPEVREMRRWLCDQVRAQTLTGAEPEPYTADLHHDVVLDRHVPRGWDATEVTASSRALIAGNDSGEIIAVSPSAADLLGYRADELIGRRVLTVIPHRFRQAHVAGMTLHAINGRSPLLQQEVTVPVLRADGSEQEATLLLQSVPVARERVFLAELRPQ